MQNNKEYTILQSYAVNYPIIAALGFVLRMPIAIVVPNLEVGYNIANSLSKKPKILDSTWNSKDVETVITTTVSDAVVWISPHSKRRSNKCIEMEEMLFNAAASNQIGTKDATVAVFMIFERVVDDAFKGKVFEVHFQEKKRDYKYKMENVVLKEELIPDIIRTMYAAANGRKIPPLTAAVCFLGVKNTLPYYKVALEMVEKAEEYAAEDEIGTLVIETMESYFKSNSVSIYTLKSLRDTGLKEFDEIPILDGNKLLLNEKFFKKTINELKSIIDIDLIKEKLETERILIPSWGGYTHKKLVVTRNFADRIRVIRLDVSNFPQITGLKY